MKTRLTRKRGPQYPPVSRPSVANLIAVREPNGFSKSPACIAQEPEITKRSPLSKTIIEKH